jgi:type II secretory ATPase GspE/PulE/Tfp pilus assembly ATPase PilB-like protein
LITSSLVGVLAQRLVRMICQHCKIPAGTTITPDGDTIDVWRGAGCEQCFGTGFHGRMGIFEMMELSEDIRNHIMKNDDSNKIAAAARRDGMRNLREDGWIKVRRGFTTPGEVTRVTQEF